MEADIFTVDTIINKRMTFFVSVLVPALMVLSYGDAMNFPPQLKILKNAFKTNPSMSSLQKPSSLNKQLSLPQSIKTLTAKVEELERLYNESAAAQGEESEDTLVEELSAKVTKLQNQLNTLNGSQAGPSGADQESLKQKIGGMQTQLNTLQVTAGEQKEKLKRISQLEAQISALEETHASTSNAVNQMQESKELSQVQDEVNIEDIRNEIQLVKENLNTLSEQMETMEGTMGESSSRIDKLRKDVVSLHENVSKIQNLSKALAAKINSNQDNECPEGFIYLEKVNNCYLYVADRLQFDQAQDRCLSFGKGGTLAILDSNKKFTAVQKYLNSLDHYGTLFIGGRRNKQRYEWLTGVTIKYWSDNWCDGEPSDRDGCIGLQYGQGICFNDELCNYPLSSLCEIPPLSKR